MESQPSEDEEIEAVIEQLDSDPSRKKNGEAMLELDEREKEALLEVIDG